MSEKPLNDYTDDDLERRVAALESEAWVGSLKELKPAQSVDLYAIGFEAGRRSVLALNPPLRPAVNAAWLHTRTALCSAAVSVAAMLLLMFTFSDGSNRASKSTDQVEVAVQSDELAVPSEKTPVVKAPADFVENRNQLGVSDVDDILRGVPASWRDRLQSVELKVPNLSESQPVADIEPSRLRYAYQRRQLMENLEFGRN